ncbi:MAG: methyltransferase domain-containing protein [Desulfobacterales bacterium]|nr:methyltransferase domain-containing protein [Desulfobacterales bacterium]
MERAPKACILCGAQERELLIEKDSWKIYRCQKCGLGFLDPRPSQEEVEHLYRDEYFSERYDEGLDPNSAEFQKRLRSEKHRVRFIRKVKKEGQVLDIGCGYGYFLAACRNEGFEVSGVDVSDWATQYAIERLGIPVRLGKVGDLTLPSHHFDIITMWHFLEHSPDPHLALQVVKSCLKDDGVLVIDVPTYKGTDAQRMWQEWDGWSVPYHFWHFTSRTLVRFLGKHGFSVIKSKDYHSSVIKEKWGRIVILKPFARLIAKMYSGHSIAVVARLDKSMKSH